MATTHVTVRSGQSLWSIARGRFPDASEAQLKRTVVEIAHANAISPSAGLIIGQRLELPDSFQGTVSWSDTTTADALPRLSRASGAANAPLAVRLGAAESSSRPLLDLAPKLSAAPRQDVGAITLAPIAGLPVSARVQRFLGVASVLGNSALETLDVRFGRLTQAQFDELKASFGGRSRVKFDSTRDYSAVDFLPPALQALVGQDLDRRDPVTLPGTAALGDGDPRRGDLRIGLSPNCHGTAWEAMRAYQGDATKSVALGYGDMIRMHDLVADDKAFETLGSVPAGRANDVFKLGMRPGDLVQFREVTNFQRITTLLHSAVYVGNGLFFEKPNTEGADVAQPEHYRDHEETPYRLVSLDMMKAPIAGLVSDKFTIEARRPTAPLPQAAKVFGSPFQKDVQTYASGRGATIDNLVVEFEQGAAGNIRTEHASALIELPLRDNADGTTVVG
ncbi:MAG: LysM peptidoglycan-binding domain-containing protein [Myxococcota bacterium]